MKASRSSAAPVADVRPVSRPRRRMAAAIAAYALVVALFAVLPVFVNTAIGYVPVIAALVLALLDCAYLIVLRRSIALTEGQAPSECTRGEVLPFSLGLTNSSILPAPRIEARFYISDVFGAGGRSELRVVTLPPRSSKSFDVGVRFDHIGPVQVGISQIELFGPLGITFSSRRNERLSSVLIGPRLVDVHDMALSDESLQESDKNIKTFINEGMDYSGIRDYRWGDPMKSIHWKLSSKSEGDYFTRLYETPTTPGVDIVLDLQCALTSAEDMMSAFDAVVESALSLERSAAENGFATELLFVDEAGGHQRVEGPLSARHADLMARIPRIGRGDGSLALGLLREQSKSTARQNNLVVCTANLTDDLVNALVSAKSPTCSPLAIVADVSGGCETNEMLKMRVRRLDSAQIACRVIRRASDLTEGGAR